MEITLRYTVTVASDYDEVGNSSELVSYMVEDYIKDSLISLQNLKYINNFEIECTDEDVRYG